MARSKGSNRPHGIPPSHSEINMRVEQTMDLLARGWSRTRIHAWSTTDDCSWRAPDTGAPVSPSTVDRLIKTATENLRKLAEPKKQRMLGIANRRLDTLYDRAFDDGDLKVALAATAEKSKVNGLYPATKIEQSGPNGGPITVATVPTEEILKADEFRELERAVLEAVAKRAGPLRG